MPSIEEAWNLPISAEMTSRQNAAAAAAAAAQASAVVVSANSRHPAHPTGLPQQHPGSTGVLVGDAGHRPGGPVVAGTPPSGAYHQVVRGATPQVAGSGQPQVIVNGAPRPMAPNGYPPPPPYPGHTVSGDRPAMQGQPPVAQPQVQTTPTPPSQQMAYHQVRMRFTQPSMQTATVPPDSSIGNPSKRFKVVFWSMFLSYLFI